MSTPNKLLIASLVQYLKTHAPSAPIPTLVSSLNLSQDDIDQVTRQNSFIVNMLDLDPDFKAFIAALTTRGYFNDTNGTPIPESTPAYHDRFQKAKLRFKQKESTQKEQAESFKNEGNAFMGQRKYEEALESYRKAIQMDATNAIYHANMAAAFSNLSRHEEAAEAGQRALELDPKYSKGAFRVAHAYDKMNKRDEALKYYKMALELEPENDKYKEQVRRLERPLANPTARPSGGMPGFPGMPDLSQMQDMFGQGGMPDLGSMGDMFNNPQFMQMAQNLMQNDEFKRAAQSMMQGMGFDPEQISGKLIQAIEEDPEAADNARVQEMLQDIRTNGPDAIQNYATDPDVVAVLERAREKIMPGVNEMASRFMGGGQ